MRKLLLMLTLMLGIGVNAQDFAFSCPWSNGYNEEMTSWHDAGEKYPITATISSTDEGIVATMIHGQTGQAYIGVQYIESNHNLIEFKLRAHIVFIENSFDDALNAARAEFGEWTGAPSGEGFVGNSWTAFSYVFGGQEYKITFKILDYAITSPNTITPTVIQWRGWRGEKIDGHNEDLESLVTSTDGLIALINDIKAQ